MEEKRFTSRHLSIINKFLAIIICIVLAKVSKLSDRLFAKTDIREQEIEKTKNAFSMKFIFSQDEGELLKGQYI